ncbi:MAG TPA: PQQ-binding-like beta-propeller repeat protein [Candidatus Sulfopaludibacter sp.]|nr:PQQ-binding-like beta-propeller repeat protein [Candidatus Sulfopaludibacter sp.]
MISFLFSVPANSLRTIVLALLLAPRPLLAQQPFAARCAACHGDDARGTAQGPGLAMNPRVAAQSLDQLRAYLEHGNPAAGMPSFADLPAADLNALVKYLRGINADTILTPTASAPERKIVYGPPRPGDWRTYNGNDSGNRYSPLKQIDTANVSSLKLKWVFPISYFGLETTPLAADGALYVTGPNQVCALDALTGAPLWQYSRPPTAGLVGDARLGTNRGVALLGDRVFFVTDNAHLLALDRAGGKLIWEIAMAPAMPLGEHHTYGGTVAPLVFGDMVVAGVAGGDHGMRGFVAAFQAETGALVWRRWTVPRAGEPGIESWQGKEPLLGGGSTWLTGSYDPASGTLYWATGNPWPDSDDRDRPGDNLFTDSILALDAKTGALKWHYQFTPHDVKDRDATEPNVLIDTDYRGKPSKLVLHADRNGFFYVLDRTNGKVLLAKRFLRRVDWASGIDGDGRPMVRDPHGCPSDAANWDAAAFSPETRLYYFLALEECVGKPTGYPDQTGQRFLRAVSIDTGEIAWEVPQPGPARAKTWSGVLATAGGLIFYGQPNGGFAAVDQRNGKTLWQFPTNVRMKASPMTFMVGDHQYIAVAAGPNILCFGL